MTETAPDSYPAEPWNLRGQLHASLFRVPPAAFPPGELDDLPPGWSIVQLGGYALVGAAWVVYESDGVLAYRELMATVLVRRGLRLAVHIVRIWVDNVASRDGGRALWAIPKELATFEIDTLPGRRTRFCATTDADATSEPIAVGSVRRGVRLPGRWLVRFFVAQSQSGTAKLSPVRTRSGITLTGGGWIVEPFGPLGFLAGRRALLTVSLRDFQMIFGSAPPVKKRGEPVVYVL